MWLICRHGVNLFAFCTRFISGVFVGQNTPILIIQYLFSSNRDMYLYVSGSNRESTMIQIKRQALKLYKGPAIERDAK